MSTHALPSRATLRRSSYDRWRRRVIAHSGARRTWEWGVPILVTVVAAVLRLWNLGQPHQLVFDETYYVKDAWSQWNLGFPATWPDGADESFAAGQTDIYTDDASFVVHPPLGKYLIGIGMWIFGPESSFGWRISAALAGTACVLVLYLLARSLTGSFVFAGVASGLLAIDGLGIVMSRVSLLDIFLTLFILLAFWFVVLDRRRHLDRLAARIAERMRDGTAPAWGPVRWVRPWVVAAGLAAGAATAVKWSGVWVLAAIGIYLVVTDALERRRLGITFWPADAVRQGVVSFLLLVPAAFVVYFGSWSGWLLTDDGYNRHVAYTQQATGFFSWVPVRVQSLWIYHQTIYGSMAGMSTEHSYASAAWQWPLLLRPTSMYANSTPDGQDGCASTHGCLEILYSMPNPLVWWAAIAATLWLLYRFAVRPDWRYAVVLTAVAATWLPWLAYPERTIFQFYTIAMWPFLLLALTFGLRAVAGAPGDPPRRRRNGQRIVLAFLIVAVVLAAFWYPLWSAVRVPYEFYWLHNWLITWV
ncbi:dolichyl-phosphate-mannose--protein mannosyltransferase [Microbacterium sp.]|uniref:dolichyl-phosphate-mannose--protein mannosyltransferase n=1 Tax=Microbacterium sp. TaxID=51671 RepID=UPI003A8670CF